MQYFFKSGLVSLALLVAIFSLGCNAPFGIGLSQVEERDQEAEKAAAASTATPTPTVTPTSTNTATPTETPEPTPTSTLVVPYTSTPTRIPGVPAGGAQQVGAGPSNQTQTMPNGGPAIQTLPVASAANVIINGSFEAPNWPEWQGVAPGWTSFDNGSAHFGWYNDTWDKVVYDGEHAQLIEIINDQSTGDRYGGIYQTVNVIAGAEYELIIHGLVRSDEGSGEASNFGYGLQYGIDYTGGQDWTSVTEWIDLPFPEHPREDPDATNVYNYGEYKATIRPTGTKLSLFIRAWKKWINFQEGNYDIDAVSLRGTGVSSIPIPQIPVTGEAASRNTSAASILILGICSILALGISSVIGVMRHRKRPFD